MDGAFKVPGLRNVELTGPYFHNGGQATLDQVIEFYDRVADFGDVNIRDLYVNIAFVDIDEDDEEPLVAFMLALTDDRVREEMAKGTDPGDPGAPPVDGGAPAGSVGPNHNVSDPSAFLANWLAASCDEPS